MTTIRGIVQHVEVRQTETGARTSFSLLPGSGRGIQVELHGEQPLLSGDEVEAFGTLNSEGVLVATSLRKVIAPRPIQPPPETKGKLYFVRAVVCAFTADVVGLILALIIAGVTSHVNTFPTFLFVVLSGAIAALLGRAFTEKRRGANALLAVGFALSIPLLFWMLKSK